MKASKRTVILETLLRVQSTLFEILTLRLVSLNSNSLFSHLSVLGFCLSLRGASNLWRLGRTRYPILWCGCFNTKPDWIAVSSSACQR